MADVARDELVATFKNLLKNGKYSDFVIVCGSDTYDVHKSVVCARSGFFEQAERFPVGKDSDKSKVELPEDEPAIIKLLIQYFYEGEYDPKLPDGKSMDEDSGIKVVGTKHPSFHYKFPHTCGHINCYERQVCPHHICHSHCNGNCIDLICKICCPDATPPALPPPGCNASQLLVHAKMYEIGDKYDVIGLKGLAREKFLRGCTEYWDDKYFASAAHYAFSTTPENDKGLRDIISNIIAKHMSLLNKPAVETLLTEFNGLALGVLKMRAKELGWIKPT